MMSVDKEAAVDRLMRFLSIEGVTGKEAAIGTELVAALREVGVPARAVKFDKVHKISPVPIETGNLIVQLAGRGALKSAPRLLFMTHMDTVPLAAGAKPRHQGKKIVNATNGAALGGDNRTGCGVLVTLAAELIAHKCEHPPITLFFTVREESGMWGARLVDKADLGNPKMGFQFRWPHG